MDITIANGLFAVGGAVIAGLVALLSHWLTSTRAHATALAHIEADAKEREKDREERLQKELRDRRVEIGETWRSRKVDAYLELLAECNHFAEALTVAAQIPSSRNQDSADAARLYLQGQSFFRAIDNVDLFGSDEVRALANSRTAEFRFQGLIAMSSLWKGGRESGLSTIDVGVFRIGLVEAMRSDLQLSVA